MPFSIPKGKHSILNPVPKPSVESDGVWNFSVLDGDKPLTVGQFGVQRHLEEVLMKYKLSFVKSKLRVSATFISFVFNDGPETCDCPVK